MSGKTVIMGLLVLGLGALAPILHFTNWVPRPQKPFEKADILPAIIIEAKRYNRPEFVCLLYTQMRQESGYQMDAESTAGAYGLMQLMAATASALGVDREDPRQNIAGGARYMDTMLTRFDGDIESALRAYNAGPGRVQASKNYRETNGYVAAILSAYGQCDPGELVAEASGLNKLESWGDKK